MRYILMHETVTNHDAIGNDIEGMFELLSEGSDCAVFATNRFNNNVRYIDRNELESAIIEPSTVLIYHHSVYWEYGFQILKSAKCRIIIKYHNITPPEFFQGYNDWHYSQCKRGRELTKEMVRTLKDAYWLCDSKYNAGEIRLPEQQVGVCPPFNKIEEWARIKPKESILNKLAESNDINLLFVGRVAPNKGYLEALQVVNLFIQHYNREIIIRFIGKFDDGLKMYNREIENYISANKMGKNVQFIGEVNDEELLAYYLGSDLMLCCSRHEGFCVPVIEAQCLGLPVIAIHSSAVPETIGDEQLCMDWDCRHLAAAVSVVARNPAYASFLRRKGHENYQRRFTHAKISEIFKQELEGRCAIE